MKPAPIYLLLFVFILFSSCDARDKQNSKTDSSTIILESYIHELDSSLIENSGLIYWNKLLWLFNDSGGKNEIYGIHVQSGEIKITIQIENALNTDWEDIAQDKNYIYIAEIGNNLGNRKDLQVLKLLKKDISKEPFQQLKVEKIKYNYSDQTCFSNEYKNHSYDCEALMVANNSLYLFTKDWASNLTKAYVLPTNPGTYAVSAIDSFDVKGLITGADIKKDGTFALVGYANYKSFVWVFQMTETALFSAPRRIALDMLENAQTEGICFTPKGDILISCEKTESFKQQIWRIGKSQF